MRRTDARRSHARRGMRERQADAPRQARRRTPSAAALALLLLATQSSAFGPDPTTAGAAFRFLVLNDLHVTVNDLGVSRAQARRTVDEINSLAPQIDFVLVAGDLGQAPDLASLQLELQAAREELDRLAVPYYVTIGNHDVTTSGDDSAFRSVFGATSLRFEHGGMQFVSLRTAGTQTSATIAAADLDSLGARLSEIAPADPLVVFAHHPLGPVTPLGVTNRNDFYARVDALNLRGVFCGHYHGTFEEERNGVWYATSSAVSVHRANHDDTHEKGYRLVSVLPDFSLASRFYVVGSPPSFAPEPPIFRSTGNRYAAPGSELRLRVAAQDVDGDAIVYTSSGLPAGGVFDTATRLFTWTPSPAQVGLHTDIRFAATDGDGADSLALAVRVVDDACVFEIFEPQAAGWTTSGGSWSTANGELVQTNASNGSYYHTAPGSWSDFYFETDFVQDAGTGYAGVVFRHQNASNNYYLWNNGSQIQLRRRQDGSVTRISDQAWVGAVAGWHHVRVEAVGPNLKVYWDGSLHIDVVDSTFATGTVGLVTSRSASRFDNVVVTGCASLYNRSPVLSPVGDRTLVAGVPFVLDLGATDPDATGPLTFAAKSLPPSAIFDAGSARLTWTPTLLETGMWRGATFIASDGELSDAETITFTVVDTTTACIYESFSGPGGGSWNPTGGTWSVGEGHYVGSAPDGNLSVYGSDPLENFTYQARVRVEGSGTGNLAFRIADTSNFYYLYTSSSSNQVELRKMMDGLSTTLARGAEVAGGVQDRWHLYRVEAVDTMLRVWVDGVLVYELVDASPSGSAPILSGFAGVRVQNATLRIDDVLVTECNQSTVDAAEIAFGAPTAPLAGVAAYPNPFNPSTTLRFDLGNAAHADVAIHDAAGRGVRRLYSGALAAGTHEIPWNGLDDSGRAVPSGVYFARVTAAGQARGQRLVLVK